MPSAASQGSQGGEARGGTAPPLGGSAVPGFHDCCRSTERGESAQGSSRALGRGWGRSGRGWGRGRGWRWPRPGRLVAPAKFPGAEQLLTPLANVCAPSVPRGSQTPRRRHRARKARSCPVARTLQKQTINAGATRARTQRPLYIKSGRCDRLIGSSF
jgi:hypothetical protein